MTCLIILSSSTGSRGLLNLVQTCFLNSALTFFFPHRFVINHLLFSDNPLPYGPVTFLAATWKKSTEYRASGCSQQARTSSLYSNQTHSMSQMFRAIALFTPRSRDNFIECQRCHNATSTLISFLTFSLELEGSVG